MTHIDEPVDCRIGVGAAIAAAAGIVWMMSPSEPSRTISTLFRDGFANLWHVTEDHGARDYTTRAPADALM